MEKKDWFIAGLYVLVIGLYIWCVFLTIESKEEESKDIFKGAIISTVSMEMKLSSGKIVKLTDEIGINNYSFMFMDKIYILRIRNLSKIVDITSESGFKGEYKARFEDEFVKLY